jgi:hypothetical protein
MRWRISAVVDGMGYTVRQPGIVGILTSGSHRRDRADLWRVTRTYSAIQLSAP